MTVVNQELLYLGISLRIKFRENQPNFPKLKFREWYSRSMTLYA